MQCFNKKTCWFTLFCALALVLFAALGAWQINRLYWKEELIASAEQKAITPPLVLSVVWERIQITQDAGHNPNEPPAYTTALQYEQCCNAECGMMCGVLPAEQAVHEFTKIRAVGWYDYANEIKLQAKYNQGKQGYRVLTPLRLGEDTAVLVDRGWVDSKISYAPPPTHEKPVSVTGVVRTKAKQPLWFLPQNNPEKGLWLWPDIPAMAFFIQKRQGMNAPHYLPFFIQQTESGPSAGDNQPIPLDGKPEFLNDHLGYAITWFALALVVAVMWGFYIRKQRRA